MFIIFKVLTKLFSDVSSKILDFAELRSETSPDYARVSIYPCLHLINDKDEMIL